MTRTKERNGKVRFYQSRNTDGKRLLLPEKMEVSNIILHESLPRAVKSKDPKFLTPEDDVYDFPAEFWPPTDTPIIPQDMGAKELFEECKRSRRRGTGNLSNSAVIDLSLTSIDLEQALRRAERLPNVFLLQNLQIIRQQLSYPDNMLFEQRFPIRRRSFIDVLKNTFKERDIGECPNTNCPEQLTREIGKRLKLRFRGMKTFRLLPCLIDLTIDEASN